MGVGNRDKNGKLMLSDRQMQVCEGIAAGKTNKMIARELGINYRTIEDHRRTAFYRLGVEPAAGYSAVALMIKAMVKYYPDRPCPCCGKITVTEDSSHGGKTVLKTAPRKR